jgi:phosphomannomutase/phosphoglucomutase
MDTLSEAIRLLPRRHIIKGKISAPNGSKILEKLSTGYAREHIDETDGLKLYRNNSWGLVRASGTEPIIRIIVDADNEKNGLPLYQELLAAVETYSRQEK